MNPHKLARKGRIIYLLLLSLFLHTTARAQKLNETILFSFPTNSGYDYGINAIIKGQDGSLYGTAYTGGTNFVGSLFQINRDGSGYHVLHSFDLISGQNPGNVLQGTNGILYGTTAQGGSNFSGAVFKINTNGTGYAQLHAFSSSSDGSYPGILFQASNGVLHGVTSFGGVSNAGTVFRLNLDGSGFQTLHQFTNFPGRCLPNRGHSRQRRRALWKHQRVAAHRPVSGPFSR